MGATPAHGGPQAHKRAAGERARLGSDLGGRIAIILQMVEVTLSGRRAVLDALIPLPPADPVDPTETPNNAP